MSVKLILCSQESYDDMYGDAGHVVATHCLLKSHRASQEDAGSFDIFTMRQPKHLRLGSRKEVGPETAPVSQPCVGTGAAVLTS